MLSFPYYILNINQLESFRSIKLRVVDKQAGTGEAVLD